MFFVSLHMNLLDMSRQQEVVYLQEELNKAEKLEQYELATQYKKRIETLESRQNKLLV